MLALASVAWIARDDNEPWSQRYAQCGGSHLLQLFGQGRMGLFENFHLLLGKNGRLLCVVNGALLGKGFSLVCGNLVA